MNHTLKFSRKPAALLMMAAVTLLFSSCKSSTEPAADQTSDSQATADLVATTMGTTSGGTGMIFTDAFTLINGGTIADGIVSKSDGSAQANDTSIVHTKTITRTKTRDNITYNGKWEYTWTFYDASGTAMPKLIKGVTDKIVISEHGGHTITAPRAVVADSSDGSWTITHLVSSTDKPLLEAGTLTRAGSITLHTPRNDGRQMTHTYTMNWTNDTLVRANDPDGDGYVTYLLGTGNSDLKAVNFKGNAFERQVQIEFHGDGTATLNVTRTTGGGTVDTYTVDVRRGIWLRDGR